MSKQRKDYRPMTVSMSSDLWDRLDDFSNEFGQSKTFIIERALTQYLDKVQAQSNATGVVFNG